jgi:Calcineurin-like phosphoesterase
MLVPGKLTSLITLASMFSLSILVSSFNSNYAFAYNFGSVGDWGCNSNTQKTLANIRSHGISPERVLALGDYSYQDTATCWLNIINPVKSITRITIGNHEDDADEGLAQYRSAFGLSDDTFYSFSYSNARILVMDSDNRCFTSGCEQFGHNIGRLQLWSQDPNVDWIIVYLHKQMYTSPNSCGSSSCSNTGSDATNLRNTYHKYFDQYGVDLVLNGHVHNFQRTYPIAYDSGSPSSPIITSTASTDYNDPTGEIFATVGTGGINLHGLSGKSSFVKYQQDDRFGGLDISIEDNGATLAGRYYTNDGVKRDTFEIHKSGASLYSYGPSLELSGP